MKFYAAAAALCSIVSAAPAALAPWEAMAPPPAGTTFYQLQTKSATAAVSGQWVGLKTGSKSYSLSSTQAGGSKFFIQSYAPTGTYAFFNTDDTRQVALQGPNGILLSLVDATSPNSGNIPSGQLMEWATFTNTNNVLFVKDGSTLTNRTWVAVKGTGSDYTVALYDGASATTANITPITINIVKV